MQRLLVLAAAALVFLGAPASAGVVDWEARLDVGCLPESYAIQGTLRSVNIEMGEFDGATIFWARGTGTAIGDSGREWAVTMRQAYIDDYVSEAGSLTRWVLRRPRAVWSVLVSHTTDLVRCFRLR